MDWGTRIGLQIYSVPSESWVGWRLSASTAPEPGKIVHLDHGGFHLGEFAGGPQRSRAADLREIFSASAVPCRVLDNLHRGQVGQIGLECALQRAGGAAGFDDRSTDWLRAGIAWFGESCGKCIAAAAGVGISLQNEIIEEKIRYTHIMGAYLTSMQIDRRLNRPMEIEAILGNPLKAAHRKSCRNSCNGNYLSIC